MELEITQDVSLSVEELALMELHSVVNILSLLAGELAHLADISGVPSAFSRTIDTCFTLASYASSKRTIEVLDGFGSLEKMVEEEVDEIVGNSPSVVCTESFQLGIENAYSLIGVLHSRGKEVYDRMDQPRAWVYQNIRHLVKNIHEFLNAVEKNSKGRYRILFDPRDKTANDYLVDARFNSVNGSIIYLPVSMPDVLRDLLANARKYTPPGGLLRLTLTDDGSRLKCVVEDTGIGIPEEEIAEVVKFGVRGSNIPAHQQQHGGGFGLTKAWVIAKGANGRMWIKSAPNKGTTVTIDIPRPAATESLLKVAV